MKAKQLGRSFVAEAIARMNEHAPHVAQDGEADAVHQLRVAVRRLRVALALFKRALPEARRKALGRDLRWLFRALGALRDLQLFSAACRERVATGAPGKVSLERRLEAHLAREVTRLASSLASPRFRRLQAGLSEFAAAPELTAHGRGWFEKRLGKKQKCLLDALELAVSETEHLHDARKALKRLRYTVELTAPAFSRDDVHAYLRPLKRMQDELGAAVDLQAWERMARAECQTRSLREALVAQLTEEQAVPVQRLGKRIAAFAEREGFWA